MTNHAFFNDPTVYDDPVRDLMYCRIKQTPAGSVIRHVSLHLTDPKIYSALADAAHRGVKVRVLVGPTGCRKDPDFDDGTELVPLLSQYIQEIGAEGSWAECQPTRTAPNRPGAIHMKFWTFSRTGGTEKVTLVGSANPTKSGYLSQYNDLYQYAGSVGVFEAYNDMFTLEAERQNMTEPYRVFTGPDSDSWRANFTPVNDPSPERADDPVWVRLNNIPSNKNTRLFVNNFALTGKRAVWIVDELVEKSRADGNVRVITCNISDANRDRLKAAGINVKTNGPGGTYTHLKGMTASYVEGGETVYRSFTGSDNLNDNGLQESDVSHRVVGRAAYTSYYNFFDRMWPDFGHVPGPNGCYE